MGRRRARGTPPPKSFDDAFPLINKLENAVITRMVVPDFTVDRALYAMFLPDVVDKLKAAFPLIRSMDRTSHLSEDLIIPVEGATAVTAVVTIAARKAGILCPEKGNLRMERVLAYEPLVRAIQESYDQHARFEKVRAAVRWLNEHATVGAARHYCPWLTSILPADHPFQSATGVIYREPTAGIGEIMPTMRECAAIMASALLCGNLDHESDKGDFKVAFRGRRDNDNYLSEGFGLL